MRRERGGERGEREVGERGEEREGRERGEEREKEKEREVGERDEERVREKEEGNRKQETSSPRISVFENSHLPGYHRLSKQTRNKRRLSKPQY